MAAAAVADPAVACAAAETGREEMAEAATTADGGAGVGARDWVWRD